MCCTLTDGHHGLSTALRDARRPGCTCTSSSRTTSATTRATRSAADAEPRLSAPQERRRQADHDRATADRLGLTLDDERPLPLARLFHARHRLQQARTSHRLSRVLLGRLAARATGTFALAGYDLTRAGTTDPDPAKADTGYLNAGLNASTRMVAATDPVIDGKTGADLGRADAINGGKKYNKGNSTSCASRSRRTSPARSHTRSTTRRATRCRSKQPATTQQRSPGRRCRTGLLAQSTLRYPSSSLAASDTSAHCTTCARPST